MEVTLGAARSDVAPALGDGEAPEASEEVDYRLLERSRMDAIVGRLEGIAQVIDGKVEEGGERCVIVLLGCCPS